MVLQNQSARAMADNLATPLSRGGRTYLETPKPIFRPARPSSSSYITQWSRDNSPVRGSPPAGIQESRRSVHPRILLDIPEGEAYLVHPSRVLPEDDAPRVPMAISDLPNVRVEQPLSAEQRRLHVEPAVWRSKYGAATSSARPDLINMEEHLSRLPADLRPAAQKKFIEELQADARARESAPAAVRLEELQTLRKAHLAAAEAAANKDAKTARNTDSSRDSLQALPSPDQRFEELGGRTEVEVIDDLIRRRRKLYYDKASECARNTDCVPALPRPPPESREHGRKAADTTFGQSNTCPPPPSSRAGVRSWQPLDVRATLRPESSISNQAPSRPAAVTGLALMPSNSDVVGAQPKPVKGMAISDNPQQPRKPDAANPASQHDYLYDIDRAHASKESCFCCE